MVEERPDEQRPGFLGARDERKQQLFLLAEVRDDRGREVAAERGGGSGGILVGVGRAAQTPRLDQRVVMVVRERDQRRMTSMP